jgi:putative NADH-flavin reductase
MPVIVVGADTSVGEAILERLRSREGEVRVFVSDPAVAEQLRSEGGVKVALGDASDGSHVGGAALGCFSAVLVGEAATDGRERSFADSPGAVRTQWAGAVKDAGVKRVIWVGEGGPEVGDAESAVVPTDRSPADVAAEVARLDAEAEI